MIKINNLVKTYVSKKGIKVRALDGINLVLGNNGLVYIVGRSGCGKTTLLNCLGGLDTVDQYLVYYL